MFSVSKPIHHKLTVKKRMTVCISIYSIHHDEENYSNPETFDLERCSAENGGLKTFKDKGVYLAFGDGPRICLGIKYYIYCYTASG